MAAKTWCSPAEGKYAFYVTDRLGSQSLFQQLLQRAPTRPKVFQAFCRFPGGLHAGSKYNRIRRRAKEPQTVPLLFPDTIEVTREEPKWEHHLYVDDAGYFGWDANTWEQAVLKEELGQDGFVAWLRNHPRKFWSLCIPYASRGEDRPLFPDLLVFRRVKGKIQVDILDPHDSGLPDAYDKAVGLARFAEKHGDHFSRIELIILGSKGEIKRLDVNREATREKVKKVGSTAHLAALFEGQA